MDIQIPLNQLRFGQDAGINARVAGRLDGIEELAANIFAQGQIENLIVKQLDGLLYGVANGNRRLAALHQIHGADSETPIPCTLHDVDEAHAFEQSLTTAITARQLHPVDQYEAFARLEERKTHEEIAREYGLSEKEVRQALALGHLSPKIRDAWRSGEIKAEVARAFTLGTSHKIQDKVFAALSKAGHLYVGNIKRELGASDQEVAELLDFVGVDVYRAAGGDVIEDLFGSSHVVSKPDLLKSLAAGKLSDACMALRAEGWSWAELVSDLPNGAKFWSRSQPKQIIYEGDEGSRLATLRAAIDANTEKYQADQDPDFDDDEANAPLIRELSEIEMAAARRSFTERQKAKAGCIVLLEDGALDIMFGVVRPAEVEKAAASKAPKTDHADSDADGSAEPASEPAISQALLQRLSVQLTEAAATALQQDIELAVVVLLAGLASHGDYQVKASVNGAGAAALNLTGVTDVPENIRLLREMRLQDRLALLAPLAAAALDFRGASLATDNGFHSTTSAVCDALAPDSLNAALRGAFDARDYFDGVSKGLSLQAIEEALGPDIARRQGKNKRPEIAAFAFANVPPTGWLPMQLRAKGYDGPPVVKPAPTPAIVIDLAATKAAKSEKAQPAKKKTAAKNKKA